MLLLLLLLCNLLNGAGAEPACCHLGLVGPCPGISPGESPSYRAWQTDPCRPSLPTLCRPKQASLLRPDPSPHPQPTDEDEEEKKKIHKSGSGEDESIMPFREPLEHFLFTFFPERNWFSPLT